MSDGHDAIDGRQNAKDVMGREDHRDAMLMGKVDQERDERCATIDVKEGGRLVEQEDSTAGASEDSRHGSGNACLLEFAVAQSRDISRRKPLHSKHLQRSRGI